MCKQYCLILHHLFRQHCQRVQRDTVNLFWSLRPSRSCQACKKSLVRTFWRIWQTAVVWGQRRAVIPSQIKRSRRNKIQRVLNIPCNVPSTGFGLVNYSSKGKSKWEEKTVLAQKVFYSTSWSFLTSHRMGGQHHYLAYVQECRKLVPAILAHLSSSGITWSQIAGNSTHTKNKQSKQETRNQNVCLCSLVI